MLSVLSHPIYVKLFTAQVVALLGTGLLTVALGLLAYDLAGESAGAVLGTALAIKMVAYVGLTPVANAVSEHLPRKAVLIGADLVRGSIALFLPFIDAVWQIYVLIFVLQAASATFTPAFQATIPDILDDEAEYTKALSLSRLAYDLENLLSPTLAGLLLLVMSYHWLFGGTVIGFIGSAILVFAASLPARRQQVARPFVERLTRGARIYLATPRLRGLLSLNLAAAAAGAFMIVNTVVIVLAEYAGSETDVAYALAAFGGGSMVAALGLPRLLERLTDRAVMLPSAIALAALTLAHALWLMVMGLVPWPVLLLLWAASGLLYAAILTPSGRLLRRSAHSEDRPAVFAAQFALSHACWLVTYPVAGWAGEAFGLPVAMALLGLIAVLGAVLAARLWPEGETEELTHAHPGLAADHPHLSTHDGHHSRKHTHRFVIDDLHPAWPA